MRNPKDITKMRISGRDGTGALALLLISVASLAQLAFAPPAVAASDRSGAADRRIAHAKELLGSHYSHSAVRTIEKVEDLESHVRSWVAQSLKGKSRQRASKVSRTILEESRKHGLDPVFLLAVIQSESSFRPEVIGPAGEIGLMQIREATGRWIAERNKIAWKGRKTLKDPVQNIRIGAAYLAYLRETFDQHGRLYIAAYNMGPGNVETAMENHVWPKDYPARVMRRYVAYYRQLKPATEAETD